VGVVAQEPEDGARNCQADEPDDDVPFQPGEVPDAAEDEKADAARTVSGTAIPSGRAPGRSIPSVRIFNPPKNRTTREAANCPRNFHLGLMSLQSSTIPNTITIAAAAR
jgi:hypothetical protein